MSIKDNPVTRAINATARSLTGNFFNYKGNAPKGLRVKTSPEQVNEFLLRASYTAVIDILEQIMEDVASIDSLYDDKNDTNKYELLLGDIELKLHAVFHEFRKRWDPYLLKMQIRKHDVLDFKRNFQIGNLNILESDLHSKMKLSEDEQLSMLFEKLKPLVVDAVEERKAMKERLLATKKDIDNQVRDRLKILYPDLDLESNAIVISEDEVSIFVPKK